MERYVGFGTFKMAFVESTEGVEIAEDVVSASNVISTEGAAAVGCVFCNTIVLNHNTEDGCMG